MSKVLVAEDEQDILELIRFTLEFSGFQVSTAANGEEAVKKALEASPDLILLDVRMPRMTGFEACEALKSDPATEAIPVVFLSARGQDADIKEGLSLGAVDYILKPFSPEELPARLKRILSASAL